MLKKLLFPLAIVVVWFVLHIPLIIYGTDSLPLHQTYVGDEQSPVNGALHIIEDKSILGLYNLKTVYYGPVFSVISIPAIIFDLGEKYFLNNVRSANDYKNILLWSWGGIVWKLRIFSVLFGLWGIYGLYKILINNTKVKSLNLHVLLALLLLICNFYYFQYSSFWKHWAIIIPVLIWQIYYLILFRDRPKNIYLVYSAVLFFVSFGVSYLGVLFQVMWIPIIWKYFKHRDYYVLKRLFYYFLTIAALSALIIAWHPHAFWRITGLVRSDIANVDQSIYSSEIATHGLSFVYYGSLIVRNHLTLIILMLFMLYSIGKDRALKFIKDSMPIILVGVVSYIIFGLISHHESRYSLPVIISLIIIAATLTIEYLSYPRSKNSIVIFFILFAWTTAYHMIHIVKLVDVMNDGPVEEKMINDTLNFQDEHPGARTLGILYYLVGHVHTKEAYSAFASSTGKDDLNLYKAIENAPLPTNTEPINMYYIRPDNKDANNLDIWKGFDRVVYKVESRSMINQFDYFDEDISRLWWYKEIMPKYIVVQ